MTPRNPDTLRSFPVETPLFSVASGIIGSTEFLSVSLLNVENLTSPVDDELNVDLNVDHLISFAFSKYLVCAGILTGIDLRLPLSFYLDGSYLIATVNLCMSLNDVARCHKLPLKNNNRLGMGITP